MKTLTRLLCLLLAACLLAGCTPASPGAAAPDADAPRYMAPEAAAALHIWDSTPIGGAIPVENGFYANSAALVNGTLYALGYKSVPDSVSVPALFRAGAGEAAAELPLPIAPATEEAPYNLDGLAADGAGALATLQTFYHADGTRSFHLLRLDAEGKLLADQLLDLDPDAYPGGYHLACTADGTCYMPNGRELIAVSPTGAVRTVTGLADNINLIISLHTAGDMLYLCYYDPDGVRCALLLDTAANAAAPITLPQMDGSCRLVGDGAGNPYLCTDAGVYRLDAATGQTGQILNWVNSGADIGSFYQEVSILADGSIRTVGRSYDWQQLIAASYTPADVNTVPDKTVVTLCGQGLRRQVLRFNAGSDAVRVVLADEYSADGTLVSAATGRPMAEEIAAGNVPDILYANDYVPFDEMAADGRLADLYPLLDADEALGREDFWPGPLAACESDGRLTCVITHFAIDTVAAPAALVGDAAGWSWQQYLELLAAHPEALPFAQGSRATFIRALWCFWGRRLLTADGCSFESEAYIAALEQAAALPAAVDYTVGLDAQLSSGAALLLGHSVYAPMALRWLSTWYAGDATLIGFPAAAGEEPGTNGAVISEYGRVGVSEACADKQAAWQFVASLLAAENQYADNPGSLALNKAVLDMQLAALAEEPEAPADGPGAIWLGPVTEREAAQLRALLTHTSTLRCADGSIYELMLTCAERYFAGEVTAAEAAAATQAEVTAYLAQK